jgi:hypothetical protein
MQVAYLHRYAPAKVSNKTLSLFFLGRVAGAYLSYWVVFTFWVKNMPLTVSLTADEVLRVGPGVALRVAELPEYGVIDIRLFRRRGHCKVTVRAARAVRIWREQAWQVMEGTHQAGKDDGDARDG